MTSHVSKLTVEVEEVCQLGVVIWKMLPPHSHSKADSHVKPALSIGMSTLQQIHQIKIMEHVWCHISKLTMAMDLAETGPVAGTGNHPWQEGLSKHMIMVIEMMIVNAAYCMNSGD